MIGILLAAVGLVVLMIGGFFSLCAYTMAGQPSRNVREFGEYAMAGILIGFTVALGVALTAFGVWLEVR